MAICQTGSGGIYYAGFGLRNGLPRRLDNALKYNKGYAINNGNVQYTIRPQALEVNQNATALSRGPMIEY